eukprot:PhF_6_TR26371/c0_g1_i2/m.38015
MNLFRWIFILIAVVLATFLAKYFFMDHITDFPNLTGPEGDGNRQHRSVPTGWFDMLNLDHNPHKFLTNTRFAVKHLPTECIHHASYATYSEEREQVKHSIESCDGKRTLWDNSDAMLRPGGLQGRWPPRYFDPARYYYNSRSRENETSMPARKKQKKKRLIPTLVSHGNRSFKPYPLNVSCSPCSHKHHTDHSIPARLRRVFRFRLYVNSTHLLNNTAVLTLNPSSDAFMVTSLKNSPRYDAPTMMFIPSSDVVVYSPPNHVYVITASEDSHTIVFDNTFAFWTPWVAEVRSVLRTLWVYYGKTLRGVYDCSVSPTLCELVCPSTFYPYTPCNVIRAPSLHNVVNNFPKYNFTTKKEKRSEMRLKQSNVFLAVCVAGLVRSMGIAAPTLVNNVLGKHPNVNVFVATWNLIGPTHKGSIQSAKGDAYASIGEITSTVKEAYGPYLHSVRVYDYKAMRPKFDDIHYYQLVAIAPYYFLIQEVLGMMRNVTSMKYEAVLLTRPDVEWYRRVFVLSNGGPDVRTLTIRIVETRNGEDVEVSEEQIADGEVSVHR